MPDSSVCSVERRLIRLGHTLPVQPKARGRYRTWSVDSGLFRTSGQLSRTKEGAIRGRAGDDAGLEKAGQAAEVAVLRCLSLIKVATGRLDSVAQIIALRGFVRSTPEFGQATQVLDYASDILIQIYDDRGQHIRTAIGVTDLPDNGLVELELEARVQP